MDIITQDFARERIPSLETLVKHRPSVGDIANLAACYFTLDEPQKALPLVQRLWQGIDQSVGLNLGIILKDLGRHEESCQIMEEAYRLNPDDPYARLAYAEGLLKAGLWRQAWPLYDNARPTQQGAAQDLLIPPDVREWQGEPLPDGHQLLVINEGGAGDRLSYARWLPKLTGRRINWVFFPYAALFSFFERLFPRERLVADGDDIHPTHWTTTFSLPAKLGVGPTEIPLPLPLRASESSIEKYKITRLDKLPIVGLCYDAAEAHQGGRKVRSLTEGQAMRLVCQTGDKVHWVNLNHGKKMPFPVSNIPFESWEDTAGLIHNLDAVVTVDTGPMHLAGALEKPMAVLLSGNSCWKFLKRGPKCYWYPKARLYRNEGHGLEQAISELVARIRQGTAFSL